MYIVFFITFNLEQIFKYSSEVYKINKTDVERQQTLGHPRSINPNMINHVPPTITSHFLSHICCLYTKQ